MSYATTSSFDWNAVSGIPDDAERVGSAPVGAVRAPCWKLCHLHSAPTDNEGLINYDMMIIGPFITATAATITVCGGPSTASGELHEGTIGNKSSFLTSPCRAGQQPRGVHIIMITVTFIYFPGPPRKPITILPSRQILLLSHSQ